MMGSNRFREHAAVRLSAGSIAFGRFISRRIALRTLLKVWMR